jgi:hypothetical protein
MCSLSHLIMLLNDVTELLDLIDNSSSPGVSDIPVKVWKSTDFAETLVQLFNDCIFSGTIPTEWKTAVVTPLYKNKGDRLDPNNYRGISVLPPIAKVFAKTTCKADNWLL